MNNILHNIIRKTDTSMAMAFDKAIKEKIKDSIDDEKHEISKEIFQSDKKAKDIQEAINPKLKNAIKQTALQWQKLGSDTKNLDKAIAIVTKKLKVDKKELKKRVLDGDFEESVWIVDGEVSTVSNFEHFCDIVQNEEPKVFELDGKKSIISFVEAKEVINFMQSLSLTSVHKFKDVLDRDVTSIKKVIKMIEEIKNG